MCVHQLSIHVLPDFWWFFVHSVILLELWLALMIHFILIVANEEVAAFAKLIRHHLQIERERSLLSSKLVDFDNLLRNPYRGPASSVVPSPSAIPENTSNVFSPASQNSFPSSVSSFGQSGVSPNTGFRIRQE